MKGEDESFVVDRMRFTVKRNVCSTDFQFHVRNPGLALARITINSIVTLSFLSDIQT